MTEGLSFFVTGATGLVGRRVVDELLSDARVAQVFALARDVRRLGGGRAPDARRLIPIRGDLMLEGLGIDIATHRHLAREVTGVVHCAANTSFSQPLDEARAINRDGTQRLLDITAGWKRVERWLFTSSAFVQGDRTGFVPDDDQAAPNWLNAYEQSKAEAESLVRAQRTDWVIARPSTIVCDDGAGTITQVNAVHRALRLYSGGLAAMLPGTDDSTLDVVTTDHVAKGVARMATTPGLDRQTFHLCAGKGAMPLDELLDLTHSAFRRSPAWCRKGIARPVRADLATYRVFERAVEDVASERVKAAVRALGFFIPQLAYPKQFCTARTDALLGHRAPAVREFWTNMVASLAGAPQDRIAA